MAHEPGAPLRVALLGCGVVGSAVATKLVENADDLAARVGARLELVDIAVRRPQRPRPDVPVDPSLFTADAEELVTRADVAAGEELLHDYATSTADPGFYLRCHCPSARCRQMVEGTDWRIPQLQQRYAGCWTPYLQRLIDGVSRERGS